MLIFSNIFRTRNLHIDKFEYCTKIQRANTVVNVLSFDR